MKLLSALKLLSTLLLVFGSMLLNAQEKSIRKNGIGMTHSSSSYNYFGRTTNLKIEYSRYLKPDLELRLNSNFNFSKNVKRHNSGIGMYKYTSLPEAWSQNAGFLKNLKPFLGAELEYNKRTYAWTERGWENHKTLRANLAAGFKFQASKHLDFYFQANILSLDIWTDTDYSNPQIFSNMEQFNGSTMGVKFRF